ncbi:MAG: response regulator transcription factor [Ilumatobacteraceae bacterium]
MKVLIVEDDAKIGSTIVRGLEAEGFTVEWTQDGLDGLWRATERHFDVIVLDIMLPGLNGFQICRRLRDAGNWTPLLMLTAKSGDLDEAEGLDTGADDYLAKPFSFAVLVARLRALLRRSSTATPELLSIDGVSIDGRRRRVLCDGVEIELTTREFDVLHALARRPDEVLSKLDVLDAVWSSEFEGDPNIVEVYIARIRRKLDRPESLRSRIETVRGAGYRMRADV